MFDFLEQFWGKLSDPLLSLFSKIYRVLEYWKSGVVECHNCFYFRGSSLNDQTTILHIDGVTESDFGTYVCSMQNKHGTTVRTIVISEEGK